MSLWEGLYDILLMRELSGACFHYSLHCNSHNHSPDTSYFFPEIIIYFIRWISGIHLVNHACDTGVHEKSLSGQLLLILPPLALVQWENKLFTKVFVVFSEETLSSVLAMVTLYRSETCIHCSGVAFVFSSVLLPRTLYFLREVEWDIWLKEK